MLARHDGSSVQVEVFPSYLLWQLNEHLHCWQIRRFVLAGRKPDTMQILPRATDVCNISDAVEGDNLAGSEVAESKAPRFAFLLRGYHWLSDRPA